MICSPHFNYRLCVLLNLNILCIIFDRFGKNSINLTLDEYENEFKRLVNFTENEKNVSSGFIGNYRTLENGMSNLKLSNLSDDHFSLLFKNSQRYYIFIFLFRM